MMKPSEYPSTGRDWEARQFELEEAEELTGVKQ